MPSQLKNIIPTGGIFINTEEKKNIETPVPSSSAREPTIITYTEEEGITREEAVQILPLPPSQVIVDEKPNHTVILRWRGTGEDIVNYVLHRRNYNDKNWQQLDRVKAFGDNLGWYEWRDATIKQGVTYIYGVSAVNVYGRESIIAESVAVTP
jgi:hypothetical protein